MDERKKRPAPTIYQGYMEENTRRTVKEQRPAAGETAQPQERPETAVRQSRRLQESKTAGNRETAQPQERPETVARQPRRLQESKAAGKREAAQPQERPETVARQPRRPQESRAAGNREEVQPQEGQENVGRQPRCSRQRREMPPEARARSAGAAPVRKRKRSYEDQAAMKGLSIALVILVVLLIAAIIYEIVLGNGTKAPGSQRMESESQVAMILEEEEPDAHSAV